MSGGGGALEGDPLACCATTEAAFLIVLCITRSQHRWLNAIGRESILSFYWPSLKACVTWIERRAQVRPPNVWPIGAVNRTSAQPQVKLSLLRSNPRHVQEEGGDLSSLAPADFTQLTAPSLHFLLAAILQNITALRYTHGPSQLIRCHVIKNIRCAKIEWAPACWSNKVYFKTKLFVFFHFPTACHYILFVIQRVWTVEGLY